MDVLSHLRVDENARSELLIESESFGKNRGFKIKRRGSEDTINMSLCDFYEKYEIINKFSASDAYKIGYRMGVADEQELSQLKELLTMHGTHI